MDSNTTLSEPDGPRPVATTSDVDYRLSIEEVSELYANAGHARTLRTLQRYCVSGHLDAQKVATATGDKYLVTPQSVARHIAQIQELAALDAFATGRDVTRQDATEPIADRATHQSPDMVLSVAATEPDRSRQAAAADDSNQVYAERLEREVEQARDERDFLREQINRKDKTIEALIERDRETNFLIRGLQELIPRLSGASRDQPQAPLNATQE